MSGRYAFCVWTVVLFTVSAFVHSSNAQEKPLKDQLVGTWIYVSSTAKR